MPRVFSSLIFIILYIVCRISAHDGSMSDDAEYVECLETCRQRQHRDCVKGPDKCGECLSSYVSDVDGICRPMNRKRESDVADGHLGNTDASVDSAPSAMNYIVQRDVVSDQVESDTANRQQLLHSTDNTVIIAIALGCALAVVVLIVILVVYCCRWSKQSKASSDVDYTPYGSAGQYKSLESKSDAGLSDRKLAHSAQMFHYQHQKQQMLELERSTGNMSKTEELSSGEEASGDEEAYTVYECPGLAETGEMEIHNPLYMEPSLTASTRVVSSQVQESLRQ